MPVVAESAADVSVAGTEVALITKTRKGIASSKWVRVSHLEGTKSVTINNTGAGVLVPAIYHSSGAQGEAHPAEATLDLAANKKLIPGSQEPIMAGDSATFQLGTDRYSFLQVAGVRQAATSTTANAKVEGSGVDGT